MPHEPHVGLGSSVTPSPAGSPSITCLLLSLVMSAVLIPGWSQGLFSAQEQPKGRKKDVFGGSLSFTVKRSSIQEQNTDPEDSHMLVFHRSPDKHSPHSPAPPVHPSECIPPEATQAVPSPPDSRPHALHPQLRAALPASTGIYCSCRPAPAAPLSH